MKCSEPTVLEAIPANKTKIIKIAMGLLGFESIKTYALVSKPKESPFLWLEAQDNPADPDRVGAYDNSWCSDAQAVIDLFAKINKPWIAFKVLAAGAIPPRAAFPFAVNGNADFLLVGMFDWQVEENVKLARRVFNVALGPNSKRTRPWHGGKVTT